MQETKSFGTARLLIVLLAAVQAACLLLFPVGVRRMVDRGVRQSGIQYATPLKLREQTLEDLRLFLAPGDYKTIHDAYDIENGVCTLRDADDTAALDALFAPAERLYLRTVQRGGNAMAAARAAMESGAMTQSQLLEQAREGLTELSSTEARMAGIAFLRSEYSVLGMDPDGMRAGYLSRWTWVLIAAALVAFVAGGLEQRLRKDRKETQLPPALALLLAAAGGVVLAVWGGAEAAGALKPGALIMAAAALGQTVLSGMPAALRRKASLPEPNTRGEKIRCVLPSALGAAGAVGAVIGIAVASRSASVITAGLNRKLASSGGADTAALWRALIPGVLLILAGVALILLARRLDRSQDHSYRGPLGTVLDTLPGTVGMAAALVLICTQRLWLGILIALALPVSALFMAAVQNRRAMLTETAVHLPGRIACAALAGLGANLAGRSAVTMGGYLACVLCALIFTRTGAKLLTRR